MPTKYDIERRKTNLKLFLYIGIASISSLASDVSHSTCIHSGFEHLNSAKWVAIVLNTTLQAAIAWRAFIDGSYERDQEHLKKVHHVPKPNKKKLLKKISPGRNNKKT